MPVIAADTHTLAELLTPILRLAFPRLVCLDESDWLLPGSSGLLSFFRAREPDVVVSATPSGIRLEVKLSRVPEYTASGLAELAQSWRSGAVFERNGTWFAATWLPLDHQAPPTVEEVRQARRQLLDAASALNSGVRPIPLAQLQSQQATEDTLLNILHTMNLRFERTEGAIVIPLDPGDDGRFLVEVTLRNAGWVDIRAYLAPSVPQSTATIAPAAVNAWNAALMFGSVAIGPKGQPRWQVSLPADQALRDPQRFSSILDHAAAATLEFITAAGPAYTTPTDGPPLPPTTPSIPVRTVEIVPRLLAPSDTFTQPVVPMAQVSGNAVPLATVQLVDPSTRCPYPDIPTDIADTALASWTVASSLQRLATMVTPWESDPQTGGFRAVGPLAAEQILLPEFLSRIQTSSPNAAVMVAVPHRGVLFAAEHFGQPAAADSFRRCVQYAYDKASEPLSPTVFLATGGAIVGVLPKPGQPDFAVLQVLGHDPAGRRVVFKHHGGDVPLNELQMVFAVAQARRLNDGTPIDVVEVVFSNEAALYKQRSQFERLGAVVSLQ